MPKLKENSNILFRGMKFSGGAPRSAYEYLNVLKADGHNVTAIVWDSEKSLKELYEKNFDRVVSEKYIYEYFERRNFIAMYRAIKKEFRMLKKEKPDLVIVLGYFNMHFYGHLCRSCSIPSIMMIAGGDLSRSDAFLENCLCDHIICFSEENNDVLKRHFDKKNISVIPNRIHIKKLFHDNEEHYLLKPNDTLNFLLTSRVSADKYDSIISFIKTVENIANDKRRISLTVAGAGNCLEKLQNDVKSIKNPSLNIEIRGHVDDLLPEFEKAHIVVGKGRSVIEPIMMNRIGCVIGDDGKIELCTKDNFDRIYHYNFSGRNLCCDDSSEILGSLVDSIFDSTYNTSQIEEYADIVRQYYSVDFLPQKFLSVLADVNVEEQKKKRVNVVVLIMKILWYKLKQRKINRGLNNEQ